MLPKAIFFDLDDTLLAEDFYSEHAWQKSCELFADKNQSIQYHDLFNTINEVRRWYWDDTKRRKEGSLNLAQARTSIASMSLNRFGCDNRELAEGIVADYTRLKDELLDFFPDVELILKELVNQRIKLALLTNGNGASQRAKVNRFRLEKYFGVCLIEGELGYGKPEPKIFELALKSMHVTAEQTWMVGNDLYFDIGGAQRLGIYSIWCDYGKKGLPEGSPIVPDKIINNITELLSL